MKTVKVKLELVFEVDGKLPKGFFKSNIGHVFATSGQGVLFVRDNGTVGLGPTDNDRASLLLRRWGAE